MDSAHVRRHSFEWHVGLPAPGLITLLHSRALQPSGTLVPECFLWPLPEGKAHSIFPSFWSAPAHTHPAAPNITESLPCRVPLHLESVR